VEVGANVTLENWYGGVISSPAGAGAITTGYGLYIEAVTKPTTKAAIKFAGTGESGRIFWPTAYLTEEASGVLSSVASSVSLAGLAGAEAARAVTVASAVNRVEFRGAIASARPSIRMAGSDTDIGVTYDTKGTGVHLFRTNTSDVQLEISAAVTSPTVWAQVHGGTAATNPRIYPTGNNITFTTGSALATTATAGMMCIASCAGTPTGVPVGAGNGDIPMIYDQTAHKIWFYHGGTWRGVLVA
jgi:hypothetical protein